ncbi:MAG TPA: hypothetical protein VHB99_12710, partial [Pirellulales bacterium]|nr:hypothetical protein [Pirellulales bacterium]
MGSGPRYPDRGGLWADFPQTLFHHAGAIAIFVAAFAAAFFIVRRWLSELQWRPNAASGSRGGVLRYASLSTLAAIVPVALFFAARCDAYYFETLRSGIGAWEFACIAFPVNTICVVWAALDSGRIHLRILFSFVFAALMALSIWIGAVSVWNRVFELSFDRRTWFALPWLDGLNWVALSLLPVAVLAATLLAVRACGYRLARSTAIRRQFTLREFLAALTLVCAGLAFVVVPAERQRRAVAALEAAGGSLGYLRDVPESDETVWDMFPASCLTNLLPNDYFDDVDDASLEYCQTTDAVLANLRALKDLHSISFAGN